MDTGRELKWLHPEVGRRYYELRSGDDLLATLEWDEKDGSTATATAGDNRWTLSRLGFLNPHVIAVDSAGKQILRFDATMSGGGMAHATDGHLYRWFANLWRAEWGWMDTAQNDLVKFHRSFDVNEKQEGTLELLDAGRDTSNLELLVLLGWYLIITISEAT